MAADRAKLEGEAGGENEELEEMDRRRSVGEEDEGAKLNVRGEPLIGVGARMLPLSVIPLGWVGGRPSSGLPPSAADEADVAGTEARLARARDRVVMGMREEEEDEVGEKGRRDELMLGVGGGTKGARARLEVSPSVAFRLLGDRDGDCRKSRNSRNDEPGEVSDVERWDGDDKAPLVLSDRPLRRGDDVDT